MASLLPVSGWVGLTVAGGEIAGNHYARVFTDFTNRSAMVTANPRTLQFPMAYPFTWGAVDAAQVWDAATGGTLLVTADVEPVEISANRTARIAAGALVITEAVYGTPYGRGRYGRGRYATVHVLEAVCDVVATFALYTPGVPGVWAPADPCETGVWTVVDPCSTGAWGPAPSPLRRVV